MEGDSGKEDGLGGAAAGRYWGSCETMTQIGSGREGEREGGEVGKEASLLQPL